MSVFKEVAKKIAVSVGTSMAFVALDQGVRTFVAHNLKKVLSKDTDEKTKTGG